MGQKTVRSGGGTARGTAVKVDGKWLDELFRRDDSGRKGPGEFSRADLIKRSGKSASLVGQRLKQAVTSGLVEFAGRREERAIDGRVSWVPVYRRVRKGKAGDCRPETGGGKRR